MPGFDDKDRLTFYMHLRTFESDFDKSQSQLRTIASAWSAAVLAAVALIVINAATPIVVPPGALLHPEAVVPERTPVFFFLRQLICLIGSLGIYAFWFVDQSVYQRLLHTVFAYGLFLELKQPDLPQLRSSLFAANLDITFWLGMFYRVQFWAFFLVSIIMMFVASAPSTPWIFIVPLVHILMIVIGEISAYHWQSLEAIAKHLFNDFEGNWPNWAKKDDDPINKQWLNRIRAAPAPTGAVHDSSARPSETK